MLEVWFVLLWQVGKEVIVLLTEFAIANIVHCEILSSISQKGRYLKGCSSIEVFLSHVHI